MKISFITTIFNEEETIKQFLDSLLKQTRLPDEIIIVDGGSTDDTVAKIKEYHTKYNIIIKPGNRSVGRNEAVRHATGDIIICSDSGNILDKKWIENIIKPFQDKNVDVVAGYYKGLAKNIFQKCFIPYVLVMPDKVDPEHFLPATRSIAFKKSVWKKVGGFPEEYSHNEDYVFAKRLEKIKAKIVFAKDAIVYWLPRSTYKQAFTMFFRFALGDVESGIIRDKVLVLFGRYLLFFYLVSLLVIYRSIILGLLIGLGVLTYLVWSAYKNYQYVKQKKAIPIFIFLQLTADSAVMLGSLLGLFKKIKKSLPQYCKENKIVLLLIILYGTVMLSLITWGIPNANHPFLYHMDEWHQSQAVRSVFTKGTPNTEGAANGTMFQFYLSGIYLIPFILTKIVNPFAIKSAISAIDMQHTLFIIFRLNTLLFGIASMILIGFLGKRFFKIPSGLSVFLFSVTPIWYSLSNYFKYDIALTFWIILAFFFLLTYAENHSKRNYVLAGIASALACATKISAVPLSLLYLLTFFIFTKERLKNLSTLFLGIGSFFLIFLLTGMPDTLFGKGNILYYLYDNIIHSPQVSSEMPNWLSHLAVSYVLVFGPLLLLMGLCTGAVILINTLRIKIIQSPQMLTALALIIFEISLLPLKFTAAGNRTLVLLPFVTILSCTGLLWLQKRAKKPFVILLFVGICSQVLITFAFLYPKFHADMREASSLWMKQHIPRGSLIGINTPPIYESIPDIILQEYYHHIYYPKNPTRFHYQDVLAEKKLTANYVVMGNADLPITPHSPKAQLVKTLENSHYKKVAEFIPTLLPLPFLTLTEIYFTGLTAMPYSITIYSKK